MRSTFPQHLLVMPVRPFEIMTSKIWANGLLVLVVCGLSLAFVIQGLLAVPVQGSVGLFLAGAALHLFATSSRAIFMGALSRSMPQFGLLFQITLTPLIMLSGGMTPRDSIAGWVQTVMLAAPHDLLCDEVVPPSLRDRRGALRLRARALLRDDRHDGVNLA